MTRIFGIPNCSTVKNARQWLAEHGIDAAFSDFKKTPPTAEDIACWLAHIPADTLLNRKGTTWRKLDAAAQAQADSTEGLTALLCAQPSLIKRPVLEYEGRVYVGFKAEQYAAVFHTDGSAA